MLVHALVCLLQLFALLLNFKHDSKPDNSYTPCVGGGCITGVVLVVPDQLEVISSQALLAGEPSSSNPLV